MKQVLLLVAGCWLLVTGSAGQTITQKLQKAYAAFEKDTQLAHAISSLYVIDVQTGKVIFDKNSRIGLAPASTQKIITSVTAFELLGSDFRYETDLGYKGRIVNDTLKGDLVLLCVGDPTFGSWRYTSTVPENILANLFKLVQKLNVKVITGNIVCSSDHDEKIIPDGWIWQDLGNYYGSASYAINWKENQFDLNLQSDKEIGSDVKILSDSSYINEVKAAARGTGDNAYVYLPRSTTEYKYLVTGTIPINERNFKISAATDDPIKAFINDFSNYINQHDIFGKNLKDAKRDYFEKEKLASERRFEYIGSHNSPLLDSIIYWFNKKSINLYGEALLKTFSGETQLISSTDSGVAVLQKFWKEKGLSDKEINICDGSGLSPLNRVTTHAQVEILKYAKSKDWFPYFYNSLPEYNGMKIKSGTIRDVKGFCGYHKSKAGKEYIFSFLVNNYNGSAGELVKKMYKVLDVLK